LWQLLSESNTILTKNKVANPPTALGFLSTCGCISAKDKMGTVLVSCSDTRTIPILYRENGLLLRQILRAMDISIRKIRKADKSVPSPNGNNGTNGKRSVTEILHVEALEQPRIKPQGMEL
jgi:hypothetical protein